MGFFDKLLGKGGSDKDLSDTDKLEIAKKAVEEVKDDQERVLKDLENTKRVLKQAQTEIEKIKRTR